MNMCMNEKQLSAALKAVRAAKKNGFNYCLAVVEFDAMEDSYWLRLRYSDLWEKAHPTDARYDWGRCQGVSERHRFVDGKIIPLRKSQ